MSWGIKGPPELKDLEYSRNYDYRKGGVIKAEERGRVMFVDDKA